MAVSIHSQCICIPFQKEFVAGIYNEHQQTWENVQLIKCYENAVLSGDSSIQCCTFSSCGRYLALCLNKDLIIFNTSCWKLLCHTKTERKGVSVQFFPKSNVILLAEKSGNVTFFKFFNNRMEKTGLILGHNSMLVQALVTDDEHFIVTCDRDEKIRITNYPNIYNIQCYCLGHTEFISSITFLASDKNVLISTSGDCSVRLWDIVTGKELSKYETNESKTKTTNCNISFFTKILSHKIDNEQSLISALKFKSNCIVIFRVLGNRKKGVNINMVTNINFSAIIWDMVFWDGNLISLVSNRESPLKLNTYKGDYLEESAIFNNLHYHLQHNWNILFKIQNEKLNFFPQLFQCKRDKEVVKTSKSKKAKYQ